MELNIGGYMYATTKAALAAAPAGKLKLLGSAKRSSSAVVVDEEEHLFVDRDGVAFEAVMAFLRTGVAVVPRESTRERVQAELAYFFDEPAPTAVTEGEMALRATGGVSAFHSATTILLTSRFVRKLRKVALDAKVLRHTRYDITWTLVLHTLAPPEDGGGVEPLEAVVLAVQVPLPADEPEPGVSVIGEDTKCFFAALATPEALRDAERLLALEFNARSASIVKLESGASRVRLVFGADSPTAASIHAARARAGTDEPPAPVAEEVPPPPEPAAEEAAATPWPTPTTA